MYLRTEAFLSCEFAFFDNDQGDNAVTAQGSSKDQMQAHETVPVFFQSIA